MLLEKGSTTKRLEAELLNGKVNYIVATKDSVFTSSDLAHAVQEYNNI